MSMDVDLGAYSNSRWMRRERSSSASTRGRPAGKEGLAKAASWGVAETKGES
jgi:hypothetical protein